MRAVIRDTHQGPGTDIKHMNGVVFVRDDKDVPESIYQPKRAARWKRWHPVSKERRPILSALVDQVVVDVRVLKANVCAEPRRYRTKRSALSLPASAPAHCHALPHRSHFLLSGTTLLDPTGLASERALRSAEGETFQCSPLSVMTVTVFLLYRVSTP